MNVQGYVFPLLAVISFVILLFMTACGLTCLPRYMAAFNPLVFFIFFPLIDRIPHGRAHMILAGGWSNIPFIIYYTAALITVCLH